MPYDAIIFDIDGTLWNTLPTCTKSWNQALEQLGVSNRVTDEQIRSVMGTPQDEAIAKLLPELYAKHQNLVDQLSQQEGLVISQEGGVFYPNVLQGVNALSEQTPIYLVSNCQTWYLNLFIKLSGLADCLTDTDCWGNAKASKTHMLLGLQQKHGFKQAVYIGDTVRDQVAAREAGFDFIYAAYGFGEVEGDPLSFDDSEELIHYLKNRKIDL